MEASNVIISGDLSADHWMQHIVGHWERIGRALRGHWEGIGRHWEAITAFTTIRSLWAAKGSLLASLRSDYSLLLNRYISWFGISIAFYYSMPLYAILRSLLHRLLHRLPIFYLFSRFNTFGEQFYWLRKPIKRFLWSLAWSPTIWRPFIC